MPRFAVPVADISQGSWAPVAPTGGGQDDLIFTDIDEGIGVDGSSHDGTTSYWTSLTKDAIQDSFRVRIQSMGVPAGVNSGEIRNFDAPHVMRAAVRLPPAFAATGSGDAHLKLEQLSGGSPLYTIAAHCISLPDEASAWTVLSYQLTTDEITSIADFSDLGLQLVFHNPSQVESLELSCSALEFRVSIEPQEGSFQADLGGKTGASVTNDGLLYQVEARFTGNSWFDISSDGSVMSMEWTSKLATLTEDLSVGEATVILDNVDGRWSPDRSDSPVFPNMLPNKELRIRSFHSGTMYDLFRGYIQGYIVHPNIPDRTTTIQALDQISKLKDREVNMQVVADYNVGSLFVDVLSQTDVLSYNVDVVGDEVPFAFFSDIGADKAVRDLIDQGSWKVFDDGAGTLQVRDRYYDLTRDVQGSYEAYKSFSYTFTADGIINRVIIRSEPRERSPAVVNCVGFIDDPFPIFAGFRDSFEISFVDPLDPNTDLPVDSGGISAIEISTTSGGGTAVASGVDISFTFFAKSVVMSLHNVDSRELYVTSLTVQGAPLRELPKIEIVRQDSSSQSKFGRREFSLESDLIGDVTDARGYANVILIDWKSAPAKVDITLENEFPDILALKAGDRIHCTQSFTGVSSEFAIYGMSHTVRLDSGLQHGVSYDLRSWADRRWLILDHAVRGTLDFNRLGF